MADGNPSAQFQSIEGNLALKTMKPQLIVGAPCLYIDEFVVPKVLHPEAQRCLETLNAGGESEISEAFSIHHLATLFNSQKCILEMEVKYWIDYKMVDFILPITMGDDTIRLGISVTRAMTHKKVQFTEDDAIKLLKKKINGLIISRRTICKEHTFFQSILHIWVPSKNVAKIFKKVIISKKIDFEELEVVGSLDIWISITTAEKIFTNEK